MISRLKSLHFPRAFTFANARCLAIFLVSVLLTFSVQGYCQSAEKTAFLPLNILENQGGNLTDSDLDETLLQELSATDFSMLPRADAQALVNYQGVWPPGQEHLQLIAEITGAGNLAVGSLTQLGGKLSIDMKLFDLLSPTAPVYFYQTADSLQQLEGTISRIVREVENYLTRDFRIASISPEGNTRIDSGAILRKIQSKTGDTYDQATLREDLKAIYKMGYFNDVQIDVTDSDKGKKVIFRVVEKPVIQSVVFEGIKELDEEDIKEAANIREQFILNPAKIAIAEEAIRQLYKDKGFYHSEIDSEISYPDDQGTVVRFKINEGSELYIKDITIEGNSAFDDDEILGEIKTNEKGFMSWLTDSGLLNLTQIKQDVQRITTFYNNHGFLDAKVGEPIITEEKEWLKVKFVIEEGVRYKVGTVDFTGDILAGKEKLLELVAVRGEKYLNKQVIRDDILKITDYYSEAGYAFASIRPGVSKSPNGNRMDVIFDIRKGNLVYIDRITIRGNTRTRDNVIRRELHVAEGGVFDSKAIRTSTQALQRLMFFEEVSITPEPSLDPDRMNIIIEVKEKSTGNFSIGAGYSSVDDFILMGQISENNFLGRGDTLSLSANLGGSSSRYNLAYTNPHLNDSELSWGIDIFKTNRESDDYTRDSVGGGFRIGYPIFGRWRIYGNYSYTDTDLTDVSDDASYTIMNSVDLHVTSALKTSLVRDTRNRRYGASSGSRNMLSVKYAGGPLQGDAQFTKLEGSTSWYFPLFWNTVFHIKGTAGQVFENETDKLPVYERFTLGGLNSIRGFDYGKISPIDDETGDRIGGDKMWYTNTEVIFPLIAEQGIMGVCFVDIGQVLNDDEEGGDSNDSIKKATGLGVRWLSPMGPLRLVWGYNLDPEEDEDDAVWDFSIGGTF